MTDKERKKLEEEIEGIKKLLDAHQKLQLMKGKEWEDYLNAALETIKELKDKLDNQ
jgi:hypothetical protein